MKSGVHSLLRGGLAASTRRNFLKVCVTAAIAFVGASFLAIPFRRARVAAPVWTTIPNQDWTICVPVYLDLAAYASDRDGNPLTFELDHPLPSGVALSGGVISGTPAAIFPVKQFIAIADDREGGSGTAVPKLLVSPNPSRGAVRIVGERGTTLETSGTIQVFTVSGQMAYERAIRIAGAHYEIGWDGRASDGS